MVELYKRRGSLDVFDVNILGASDADLERVSGERSLGLSVWEMKKIRDYFRCEGRNPTDAELEAFAQSWSKHCYKTQGEEVTEILVEAATSIVA